MKNKSRKVWFWIQSSSVALVLCLSAPRLAAQPTAANNFGNHNNPTNFNPPPCDFNDAFYGANGVVVAKLDTPGAQRFGFFRQTGPPAFLPHQQNWTVDNTCSQRDPERANVRILATTGGYIDDGTGAPTDFISIIAFLTDQSFFNAANQSGASGNARGDAMVDIVSNFEAYAAPRQRLPNGQFALTACGTMGTGQTPCFPVTSVATPNLRQDWRFASNRNAIDGSDNNVVNGSGGGAAIVSNSPYGYFCDDLLGMWVVTYFWYTVDPAHPGQTCGPILASLARKNGVSLDGTPIIKTADELNNQLEANGCGAEGQEDVGGADGGAVWIVCPTIPDPRDGAIAHDAFLDQVRRPNGAPLDFNFTMNFLSLQMFGAFPNELTPAQASQLNGALASAMRGNPNTP
ncbi:MAG TPA: hypothetical protein VH639_22530 [Bryobacteraceae bacterium]